MPNQETAKAPKRKRYPRKIGTRKMVIHKVLWLHRCSECREEFRATNRFAHTCSNACRQRRAKRREAA